MATTVSAAQRKEAKEFLKKTLPSDLTFAVIDKDLYTDEKEEEE